MEDDVSEACSTLATFAQDAVLENTVEVTLDDVYSGTVFKVKDIEDETMTCILAGVVAPIPKQPGYELSMQHLQECLSDVPFLILIHENCAEWYQATPVSVIANNQDLTMCLLQDGWVKLDEHMPKKCHKTLFRDQTYLDLLVDAQSRATLNSRGLNKNPVTRDAFMHPTDYYDAVLKDQGEALCFYFATKSPPNDYQPYQRFNP
jgi:hypothetical protein